MVKRQAKWARLYMWATGGFFLGQFVALVLLVLRRDGDDKLPFLLSALFFTAYGLFLVVLERACRRIAGEVADFEQARFWVRAGRMRSAIVFLVCGFVLLLLELLRQP